MICSYACCNNQRRNKKYIQSFTLHNKKSKPRVTLTSPEGNTVNILRDGVEITSPIGTDDAADQVIKIFIKNSRTRRPSTPIPTSGTSTDNSKNDPTESGRPPQTEKKAKKSTTTGERNDADKKEDTKEKGVPRIVTNDEKLKTDTKPQSGNVRNDSGIVPLSQKATTSTSHPLKATPETDLLMAPAVEVNDPFQMSSQIPGEKEVKHTSIADTRTRRPTTPIPVPKPSLKADDTDINIILQRDSLKLPPSSPDIIHQRGSIADSRTRRPTTPIPIPHSVNRSESPIMSSVPENGQTSNDISSEETENAPSGNVSESSRPNNATPTPSASDTSTIIQRVDIEMCRFPGIEPKPLFLGSDIKITVTSPDGATIIPTSVMLNEERREDHQRIAKSKSRMHFTSPEPNIKPDDESSTSRTYQSHK